MSGELFVLLLALMVMVFIYKLTQHCSARRDRKTDEDRLFSRDLDRSLDRMEQRMEALETLLLERKGPIGQLRGHDWDAELGGTLYHEAASAARPSVSCK